MRALFLTPWLVLALVAGCASRTAADAAPRPKPSAAQAHEECAGRMYASRSRGAVHWNIYENCLKERQ